MPLEVRGGMSKVLDLVLLPEYVEEFADKGRVGRDRQEVVHGYCNEYGVALGFFEEKTGICVTLSVTMLCEVFEEALVVDIGGWGCTIEVAK